MEAAQTDDTKGATEVSYEQALLEESNADQAEAPSAPMRPRPGGAQQQQEARQDEEPEDDLDLLKPKSGAKQWTFGTGDSEMSYVQRELSVIAKTQWFSLVGEVLDKAIGGENSLSLNALLAPPESVRSGQQFRMQDLQDADTFVHAIGKLLVFAPEFLEKSICIWLMVPDYEWTLVRTLLKQSPEIGGLSDDDAEEMIAIFIDQNYKALSSFFRDRFGHLRDRWQARAKENVPSRSPKR